MFCVNCGQKLPDGAKFCSNCGKPMYYESKSISIVLFFYKAFMTLSVIWCAISGFIPIVSADIVFGDPLQWSFFDILSDVELLQDLGVELDASIILIAASCIIIYILGIICAVHFIYKLCMSVGEKFSQGLCLLATTLLAISTVLIMGGQAVLNYQIDYEVFSILTPAWITIAVELLNLFIIVPAYEKALIPPDKSGMIIDAKECQMCHMLYRGEKGCPKCGSTFIVK